MVIDEIVINKQVILPGQSSQVMLASYRLPTKTVIEIPAWVFRSEKPGPVVLLLAGMHGDEINGIEIIRRMISRNHLSNLISGSVIAVPVINIVAFLNGSRTLPDGRDLNRCFPGNVSGSLGSRIANDLMHNIVPQIDLGVDFHTGGGSLSNFPQIRCNFKDEESYSLAQQFAPHFILNSGYRDKSLRKEAQKIRKNILVYEGGEAARFDEFSIDEGIQGCFRLFNSLGMTQIPVPDVQSKIITKSTWLRARTSGFFHSYKRNGSLVRKNEVIGSISDPYGETERKLKSPVNGFIIGLNNHPVVNQGDAIVHFGAAEHFEVFSH